MSSDVPVGTVWTSDCKGLHMEWVMTPDGLMYRCADGLLLPSAFSVEEMDSRTDMTRYAPGTWPPKPAPSAAFVAMREACKAAEMRYRSMWFDIRNAPKDSPTTTRDEWCMLQDALALAEKEVGS